MNLKGVTKSAGRYYKIIQSGERDESGKLKRKWIPLSRVDEGMEALARALDNLDSAPVAGMRATIADYLKEHLPTLTPAVRKEHARMFDLIGEKFQDFTVPQVRPRDCLDFLARFNGKRSAMQSYKYRMSAFFSWCVVRDLCETNPLREVTVKAPIRKRTLWTDRLFIDIQPHLSPMMRVYHRLSFLVGQRTTDVRTLLRSQIKDGMIHFKPSKTASSSGAEVKVRITQAIQAELDAAAAITREAGRISPYVIHSSTGDAYTRSAVYTAYLRADMALHGGKPIGLNPKALRPFAATCAEKQGASLRQIQKHLAHQRQGTTEGYIQSHDVPVSDVELRLPE